MTIRRNRGVTGTYRNVEKPDEIKKQKSVSRKVKLAGLRKIQSYQRFLLTVPELIQSNDILRKEATKDFMMAVSGNVENERQARYADLIDVVPIIGDVANLVRLFQEDPKYHGRIITDFLLGAVPIVGDIADFLFGTDTNRKIAEDKLRREYYLSLVNMGREDLAEEYLRSMKKSGEDIDLGHGFYGKMVDGISDITTEQLAPLLLQGKSFDEWEKEKITQVADEFSKHGFMWWRKVLGMDERKGKEEKIRINPEPTIEGMRSFIGHYSEGENFAKSVKKARKDRKKRIDELDEKYDIESHSLISTPRTRRRAREGKKSYYKTVKDTIGADPVDTIVDKVTDKRGNLERDVGKIRDKTISSVKENIPDTEDGKEKARMALDLVRSKISLDEDTKDDDSPQMDK